MWGNLGGSFEDLSFLLGCLIMRIDEVFLASEEEMGLDWIGLGWVVYRGLTFHVCSYGIKKQWGRDMCIYVDGLVYTYIALLSNIFESSFVQLNASSKYCAFSCPSPFSIILVVRTSKGSLIGCA